MGTGLHGNSEAVLQACRICLTIGRMKTLTIRLPDELARRLEREAIERRVSKSEIVRERLDQETVRRFTDDGLRGILEASWSEKPARQPRRFQSGRKQQLADLIRAKKLHR